MRLRAILFAAAALAGLGAGAGRLGQAATDFVERTTQAEVAEGLAAGGETWAKAKANGLVVTLEGAAPDEASRLRAAEIVRRIVDPARVRDATSLAASDPLAPPPFALELLRNDAEISLIGLAPEASGRAAIQAALASGGLDAAVVDMIESVAHPAPDGWAAALDFGLKALRDLPRAKISVSPGAVAITALAESEAARDDREAALRAARPADVALTLEITAPRPVIAPFALAFTLTPAGPRLVCAAETPEDAAAIARAAGTEATCALGLGAPSPDWAAAAVAGVQSVRALGGGAFALRDHLATLTGPDDAAPDRLRAVAAALEAALPEDYALAVEPPAPRPRAADATPPAAAPPFFAAALRPDGAVELSGRVGDATSRAAIAGYATALFGHSNVADATVVDPSTPEGWPGRVLTGIEALALMKEGALEITPERVRIDGWAEEPGARAKAEALFAAKDVGPATYDVRFDAAAAAAEAAALAEAADPIGTCVDGVAAVQDSQSIAFRPGSAELEASSAGAIAAIAAVMAACPPLAFEVAGHTDSQGRAESNQRLSEERAAAVKAALEAAGPGHLRLVARGYGAERPIASNDDEAGRARNRRIAFTLLPGDPASASGATPPETATAATSELAAPEPATAPISATEPGDGPR